MTHPVLDLGSNLEENLQRWSNALKGLGAKLGVWKVIYSGKRKYWTAKEISSKLKGKVTPKRVTEAGKRLTVSTPWRVARSLGDGNWVWGAPLLAVFSQGAGACVTQTATFIRIMFDVTIVHTRAGPPILRSANEEVAPSLRFVQGWVARVSTIPGHSLFEAR
jgi:hypothetical protein